MLTDHLVHTAEIRRRSGREDRFGQPSEPRAADTPIATYRARLTVSTGGERNAERSHDVVFTTHTLFLEANADVNESDRITVKDEFGRVLVAMANPTLVSRPRDWQGEHHVEVKLTEVRSSDSGQR